MDLSRLAIQEIDAFRSRPDTASRAPANRFPEMPDYFLCALCRKLMEGSIYICLNNHSRLCSDCCVNLEPCPDCGLLVLAAVDTPRNDALETQIALVKMDSSNLTNQQREPRLDHSASQAVANRSLSQLPAHLLCSLCRQFMDGHIYFCMNKHSRLCSACVQERKPCPDCDTIVIAGVETPRNYAMEQQISQMKERNTDLVEHCGLRQLPCHFEAAGCKLRLSPLKLVEHRVDCLFRMVQCPIVTLRSCCQWKGINNNLAEHIRSEHPDSCGGKEAATVKLDSDSSEMQVIRLGAYNFLMEVRVDVSARHVSWAVALIGTGHAARSWTYEVHIFNNNQALRRVKLTNFCVSDAVSKQRKFSRCARLPLSYALTYLNADNQLSYKVFIKKT